MERKAWLFASLLVAGLFVACGGSGDKSCTASSDCDPGTVCQDSKCAERLCNGTGDCSGDDICVPGALVGKDPNFRYCTAVQCKTDGTLPCTGVGQVCQNGLCVTDTTPTDVIETVEPDDGRPDVPVEDAPGTDVIVVEENCKSCENDDGCSEGYKCLPVGSAKYCLRECEDGGDCPGGYLCYASSSVLKNCLPATYSCVACAFDTPCEEGKCCDFGTGECKDCRTECQACTYDFDCTAGMRCYKKQGNPNGVCVEECADGTCTDAANFTCGANASGVMVCQPNDDEACGGCAQGTYPKPDGTGCVECLNSSHCDSTAGEVCNLTTNVCEGGDCPGGYKCDDGECHQCCEDAHCSNVPNATGTCLPTYVCDGAAPCNGACTGQYPVCATINGIEQCVQCKVDADCQGIDSTCTCTGEPLYSCTFPDGSVCMTEGGICAAPCLSDAECPPGTNGEALSCHLITSSSGICYNPSGACDQATMCCGAGQTCFDIMSILFGGLGGGMPGMPGGAMPTMFGYCSCDSQHPCLGGGACTPTAMVCIIPMISDIVCAGGALPAGMPENLCIDLASLLGGLI